MQTHGKCYVRKCSGSGSGINREYYDKATGKRAIGPDLLKTLNDVKIPKTYTNVVICPHPENNLLAQAVDGKGQLQYFYSDKHKVEATRSKNCNLIHFGRIYNNILQDVRKILETEVQNGIKNPELLLHALALRIMTLCHFRPGGTKNLRDNGTYGLTTMEWQHYLQSGNASKISFRGKKNQINTCVIRDPVARSLLSNLNKNEIDLNKPILSHNGAVVTPKSLNDFLHNYHPSVTTKTWRTWFANLSYVDKINALGIVPGTERDRKILSNRVIRTVAEELHHTLAVNKRNYLIKELEELFINDPERWLGLTLNTEDSKDFLLSFLGDYCELQL